MSKSFKRFEKNFGTICKLKGNRRCPFMVRSRQFKCPFTGNKKRIIVGYYETYNEALKELIKFNEQNNDILLYNTKFYQLLDKVLKRKEKKVDTNSFSRYKTVLKYFEPLNNKLMVNLKFNHYQDLLDSLTYSNAKICLTLIKEVLTEAFKLEINVRDVSNYLELPPKQIKKVDKIVNVDTINKIWSLLDKEKICNFILIQLYSGCRINEVLKLKTNNIYLNERYFITGSKTKSGKNRIIPIHKRLIPIFEKLLENNYNNKLFENPEKINYEFKKFKKIYNFNFTSHFLRHTFISRMQSLEVSKVKLQKIVGHSSSDVTDGVYTHFKVNDLIEIIDKLYY